MNRILLCGLWVLLCTSNATAIWCFHCDMLEPRARCPPGKKQFCWAGPNARCSTGRLYIGHEIIYVQRICSLKCEEESLPPPKGITLLSHEVICCDTEFCNWE